MNMMVAVMIMMTTPKPQCVQSSEPRLLIHTRVPSFEAVQVRCPDSDDEDDDHDDHDNYDDDHDVDDAVQV